MYLIKVDQEVVVVQEDQEVLEVLVEWVDLAIVGQKLQMVKLDHTATLVGFLGQVEWEDAMVTEEEMVVLDKMAVSAILFKAKGLFLVMI